MNNRFGKKVHTIWLTEDEERLIKESLEKGLWSSAWLIIKEAHERGDFLLK